jgi:hypothetical protein
MLRPTTTSTGHGLENDQAATCRSPTETVEMQTGIVSPVVEPTAVMTTMTRTHRTTTAAKPLTNTKVCDDPSTATDSSTTCILLLLLPFLLLCEGLRIRKIQLLGQVMSLVSWPTREKLLNESRHCVLRKHLTQVPMQITPCLVLVVLQQLLTHVDSQWSNQHSELVSSQSLSLANTTHLLSATLVNDDSIRDQVRQ